VLLGAGAGAVVGVGAAGGARSLLFEVSPLDPVSLGGALMAMAAAALLASYLPARRVGRIDPTEAMRSE
jgi:ABC-type antimicrobial peptide transport system permease subunit